MSEKNKGVLAESSFWCKYSSFVIFVLTVVAYVVYIKVEGLGLYYSLISGILCLFYSFKVKNYVFGVIFSLIQVFMFFFAYIIGMTIATILFNMGITSSL